MHEHPSCRPRRARAGILALAIGVCLYPAQFLASPAEAAPAATTAVTSVAQKADTPVNVVLGLSASTRSLPWGSSVTLTARVTDPRTGQAVNGGNIRFQAWRNGTWRTWQSRSATGGVARYTATPYLAGRFRALYTGLQHQYRWTAGTSIHVNVVTSRAKVISEARKHFGTYYRHGAGGARGFDCSGFTQYVYGIAAGKKLPHKANLQQRYGKAIAKSHAEPGDLIVIRSGSYGTHAGIYAGDGYMYAAPRRGKAVGKHKIWSPNYVVRRIL